MFVFNRGVCFMSNENMNNEIVNENELMLGGE